MKRGLIAIAALGIGTTLAGSSMNAQACSPARIRFTVDAAGQPIPAWTSEDYFFIGEVVGEEEITTKTSAGSKKIATLRVRVISSETPRTRVGEILNVHQWMLGGSACEIWGGMPLTTNEVPAGARVRVIARQLAIPSWELRHRVVRVD